MPERPRNIGVVDQAQQQLQLITTSSNTVAKPPETTASNSLTLLQREPTPNGLTPTASRGKLSSSDSQVSTNRTPNGVKDNQTPTTTLKVTHDDRFVRPSMVTVSTTTTTTPTTPKVIVRSVPVSRRTEGFSMIPRPQNIVQQPVSHPVRVYDTGKQQWQSRSNETDVKMGLNSTTTTKVPDMGAKFRLSTTTKIGSDGSGQNLKKQSVGPIDRKAMIRDGQNTPVQRTLNSPQPVPVKFNTPQNPNIRSIGIRHAVSSDGLNTDGYSRDANRITIIHAEATDSTVNSELSDFEDDSNVPHHHPSLTGPVKIHPQPPIPPMKRGSMLVYPKPLNERILSSLAEDVGWKGPDRDLTFVPQRNSRYINPRYSCGPEYSSTGNLLAAASAMEHYHPVQRAPVTVSNMRPYLQQRHTKHMNQYKSTPDIMNATRPYTSSRLPYRSTSQDPTFAGPPQSMRRNYNYTGSTGYFPNTIPETDDSEPETQTYNNESQAMHTPRSYRDGDYAPTTISGLSQSYDFHPVQSPVPGYPIMKDERHDQTLPRRSITHAMANLNTNHYGYGTDRNDPLLYDELHMTENRGENPYMPLPTTPKSFRALPYERQNSSHLLPNQISPTDVRSDSMNYRMDDRKDTMTDFDPIFFERRRSVNIPQDLDYMNARWRGQSHTMGPDFYHSGGIPSDFQLPGSVPNQMHSISGPEASPATANTRMMMMMSMMKDPGYIHVRAPTVPEQSDIYGMNPYIRGPNASYQDFAQSNLFGSRPRSLCDNLLIQPLNQEAFFNPAEYCPTPMRSEFEQTASAKPYYGNRDRKTYSEWDVSRIGLSDDQPSLHPDSYIHTRPNIRRGFGGNYTRPNAGLSRVDSNGHATSLSGRSQSLERPHNRASSCGNARTGQTVPDSSVNGTRHATSSRATSSTNSTVSSPSKAPTRMENPVRISSPTERTPAPVSTRPGSKIAMHSATPPLITWREKSTKEIQADKKIRKLIGQLPAELQQTTSFVLLMMNSTGSDEDCDKGLEARLRQAFQMIVPIGRSSPISEGKDAVKQPINGFAVMDEAKSSGGTQLLVNGASHIGSDESNEMANNVTDPRMTQSCFLPSKLESNRRSDPQNLPNPSGCTFACSLDSDASTGSDMDMTVSNSASDEFADFVPRNVSTVLRLLARCMAERLAWKRNQLVDAQQHVTRNTSERKWVSLTIVDAEPTENCTAREMGTKKAERGPHTHKRRNS
ncbi:hypothetical protein FGIG_03120 [Fasciola gigantica]|uniref:Uncharacterized protein n=1 Tax=Fasciola gigantica TaxID=46835 RepID=A0A504YHA6_FASGI|nr:hypothetical protein FGIG_03120 [Fasciola gigantica]